MKSNYKRIGDFIRTVDERNATSAFAAGAMLALVAVEVAPQAIRGSPLGGLSGVAIGALAMLALSAAIGSDRLDARA